MHARFGKNIIGINMKKLFKLGLCIASLCFAAHAESSSTSTPMFGEYPEPVAKLKVNAKPKLVSGQDREFKTRIAAASNQGVNFAGHYVLSSFGCGAACVMAFALDKKSGEVTWLPFTVCCWGNINNDAEPLSFKKNSRLVIITGSRNEQGKGIYYYEFKNSTFALVSETQQ
jgi:hypothetical protein